MSLQEDQDLTLKQAVADQAPEPEPEPEAPADKTIADVVDELQPRITPRPQLIGPADDQLGPYVQKELSVLGRMQWFALVGEVMDRAMSGENALTIGHLFEAPAGAREGQFSVQEFREADTFVKALSKLVRYAPDFFEESFVIWLKVPEHEQRHFIQYVRLPEAEGGLSEDDFFEIVETFIDQNWGAIERFFRERLVQLRKRAEAARTRAASSSRSSTRSSSTRPTTGATR